ELSDVSNAAMSEFEGLRCGKKTTLVFVQSGKGVTHCLLHRPGILGDHRGLLPKAENPFPDRPDYHPNRAPKRPNATVNKFRILSCWLDKTPPTLPAAFRIPAGETPHRNRRGLTSRARRAC